MHRSARRAFLTLTALAFAAPAFAWGPQGHRVIARVAADRLTPAAREAVRDLLHPGDTLPDVADWADHQGYEVVPRSAPWHYVNVSIRAEHYGPRDCARGECVVEKIKHFRKVLADRGQPKQERQRALLFLVHFVSDIHQPLHVGDNGDHGGNDTQVQFFDQGTNLHRLWDSDLIRRIGGNDQAWVARVDRRITKESARAWAAGTVEDWADESLRAAKHAYREAEESPSPMPGGTRLGESYVRRAEPVLVEQMARAGVRLAEELNSIFR